MNIKIESINEPWSFEDIVTSYHQHFIKTTKMINSCSGGKLTEEINCLNDMRVILQQSLTETVKLIERFCEIKNTDTIWQVPTQQDAEENLFAIRKSLFFTSSSAMALVDHARRFNSKYKLDSEPEKRREIFHHKGLHDFIQGLRNICLHKKLITTGYTYTIDFENNKDKVKVLLDEQELLNYDNWKNEAVDFVRDNSKHGIDLTEQLKKYSICVTEYYDWHKKEVQKKFKKEIEQYQQYKDIIEEICNKDQKKLEQSDSIPCQDA